MSGFGPDLLRCLRFGRYQKECGAHSDIEFRQLLDPERHRPDQFACWFPRP